MAFDKREAILCENWKQSKFTQTLFTQKQACMFCDVILRVCGKEIRAHSNILAAMSPYFNHFFSQDLPRMFSQHSPQIVEIQIDGNEANTFYQDAVEYVIDFLYTGSLVVNESNVTHVYEISKIMDIQNISKFCEDFSQRKLNSGDVYHLSEPTCKSVQINTDITAVSFGSVMDYWFSASKINKTEKETALLRKLRSQKLSSVSVQTVPSKPMKLETDQSESESLSKHAESNERIASTLDETRPKRIKIMTSVNDSLSPEDKNAEKSEPVTTPSNLISKRVMNDVRYTNNISESVILPVKNEDVSCERNSKVEVNTVQLNVVEEITSTACETQNESENIGDANAVHIVISNTPLEKGKTVRNNREKGPEFDKISKTYSCDECDFITSSARELTVHSMSHKLRDGCCFYCDLKCDEEEQLLEHMNTHSGKTPFLCRECNASFKTRTMLNLHTPKHSNEKPFVCEICSMAFKWKHALKSHMTTHSSKKDHLCDICGFSTAWKSQLKIHSLIHQGMALKCPWEGCDFQTTKKQNMQHHQVTHTGEKKHVCEICGQKFSLRRNMRRHMFLHYSNKQHKCNSCDFSTSRIDKLKEHQFKQHDQGTAPERRIPHHNSEFTLTPTHGEFTLTITGEFVKSSDYVSDPHRGSNLDMDDAPLVEFGEEDTEEGMMTTGEVVAVIKESESDTYAILNSLLSGAGSTRVVAQSINTHAHLGSRPLIVQPSSEMALSQFTAQQLDGEDSQMAQLLGAAGLTSGVPINFAGAGEMLEGSGDSKEQESDDLVHTDSSFDRSSLQLIKIEDLPAGFSTGTFSSAGSSLQVVRGSMADDHRLTLSAVNTASLNSVMTSLGMGQTQQVLIQTPDGSTVPVQFITPHSSNGNVTG